MTIATKSAVHVVGMGSMGTLLAVNLLHTTNTEVIPLFRNKDRMDQFQKESNSTIGIRRLYLEDQPLLTKTLTKSYCPETFTGTKIENLIVTTKTYQTKAALQPYLSFIDSNTNLILIQNGLGVLEVLRDDVFANSTEKPNLFQGVIGHGVFQDTGYVFNHAGFANLKIARLPWNQNDFAQRESDVERDALDNSLVKILMQPGFVRELGCEQQTYQSLLLGQLFKFLINSCINPVTAILDCDNGEIKDSCRDVFCSIVEESLSVLRVAFKPLFDYEKNYNGKADYPILDVNNVLNVEHMIEEINRIGCIVNAKNSSSMRQDTRYLRDTEIAYINGYIVSLAEKLQLGPQATKTNKIISELAQLRLSLNRTRASNK
ncbi:uncharacterized protein KNAG_0B04625 [Huiozyma naganishii CBS 8797]|uniref:2-dehydropantoate 2-reductase n=1 Tax=Huiozyma naganishii (strain ATCC MYA-139 / BCRC 22969 / CBS 8797 / KCTC 17520 / NBRC 10181 / NCYC 3082 / Yp74L-3) TaxID=1071383 RepID=J7RVE9_HUIN7|nr:hypothetical protein KNAG_0B04625 [Kazachstania naganishii CBS 8797]CCK68897.1 hypothetical protein KNAG_0B04625 [Kazachstania naganishii CBS 8797]